MQKLKADIDNPLAVILIINTAAHTIGAAVAGSSFNAMGYGKYMSAFSLAFTLVMVQYTEILPKTIGVRFNTTVMRIAARPLQVLSVILKPLIKFSRLLNRPFEGRRPERPSAADEISALANAGILLGYPDNTFRPEKIIDRGEMAALLNRISSK